MQKLTRALNIEQGEENQVLLILIQSFFIGTFMATFDVTANALFFTKFEGSDLGKAYAYSALIGMAFTYVYIKLQSSISFTKLAVINLSFIAILTILMRLGFEQSSSKWLIYSVFLLQGPLNTLAIVGFWGLMGRVFNLRQGKRLFGLVDSGQILGMILILFSVPLIRTVMPNTEDLVIISAAGITLSVIMQLIINKKYGKEIISNQQKQEEESASNNKSKGIGMFEMLKNPYISMMILFVMLAMLAQFFVHYSFLVVSKTQYPDDGEFTSFLAVFMAILMTFTFGFKTFIFGRLMEMYGLKVNLLILPLLLIFFTVVACISGTFFGYSGDGSGFQMFFIFIIVSKLFAQSLRMAIEVPAFKLLYQPLDANIKFDVQAKIDGTVNEFAALIGGLVLMGLSLISIIELIHYSYVLVIIIAVYIFISFKLYSKYRDTLHETLNSFKNKLINFKKNNTLKQLVESIFSENNSAKTLSTLKICKEVEPNLFQNKLRNALESNDAALNDFALKNVNEFGLSQYQKEVENLVSAGENSLAPEVLEKINVGKITKDIKTISRYLRSKNYLDKTLLINEISTSNKSNLPVLAELLKDPNQKVRQTAILASAKMKEKALLPMVIENIDDPLYRNAVVEALLMIGSEMFEILDLSFYKSSFSSDTLVQIVNVYQKTGDKAAIPYLLKKLNYPDQKVVISALNALKTFDFKAQTTEASKVQQSIEDVIGIALWNMVAMEEAKEYDLPKYLINSLTEEVNDSIDRIYTLLSLVYDAKSISNIRENIESGTSEGIGFAIELLDLFVAEELKPKLFPLFDDISLDERIYRMELFYPVERLDKNELLVQLINRDYNHINNWTKSCALYALIISKEEIEIKDDFIAQLFNMDPLLYECAAWLLHTIDKDKLSVYMSRIYIEKQSRLEEFLANKKIDTDELLFEKGLFLLSNNWLSGIHGKIIGALAKSIKTIELKAGDELAQYQSNFPLAIVRSGSIEFNEVNARVGDIFSDLVLKTNTITKCLEDTKLYVIENESFYDLLYLHEEFLNIILELIDAYHSQGMERNEINS